MLSLLNFLALVLHFLIEAIGRFPGLLHLLALAIELPQLLFQLLQLFAPLIEFLFSPVQLLTLVSQGFHPLLNFFFLALGFFLLTGIALQQADNLPGPFLNILDFAIGP